MKYDIKLGARVMVGIPTLSANKRTEGWTDAMSGLQMPLGSSMGRQWVKDKDIDDARNELCQIALTSNVEYLFMLGDDVIAPGNTLLTMLEKIGRGYYTRDGNHARASMITGIYWTKTYPPAPYIFRGLGKGPYTEWIAGEFFDVDFAGCDCLLIETAMLREIPFPWFSRDWVWEPGQGVSPMATEDYYFYTKAREHGFRIFADTSIQCLHEDRHSGAGFGLTMNMPQARPKVEGSGNLWQGEAGEAGEVSEQGKIVADLGAGLYTPGGLGGPNAKLVRFDIREDVHPDVRCDIAHIDAHWFNKFDVVFVHHVLEHFRRVEAPRLIEHWVELLKVGGTLEIHVPNFEHAANVILGGTAEGATGVDIQYAWAQVYGDQAESGAPWQHLNGFTPNKLRALLTAAKGLDDIVIDTEHDGLNLKATAILRERVAPYALTTAWERIAEVEAVAGVST